MAYVLCTDNCADLPISLYESLEIPTISLIFTIDGVDYFDNGRDMDAHAFYERVRAGAVSTTTLVNTNRYMEFFSRFLQQGQDILYMAFSSALSGSYQSAVAAAEALRPRFPERTLRVVDTKAASMGQGLMVYTAAQKKAQGMELDELADWVEANRLHFAHWFTVDDLHHLRRGGRVSGAAAFFGSILSIKPVLHVDDEGRLIPMEKQKRRRRSLKALVDHMKRTVIDSASQTVMISHGDVLEDAEYVASLIRAQMPVKEIIINHVGPVIGAHSGPGTIALFFYATSRD